MTLLGALCFATVQRRSLLPFFCLERNTSEFYSVSLSNIGAGSLKKWRSHVLRDKDEIIYAASWGFTVSSILLCNVVTIPYTVLCPMLRLERSSVQYFECGICAPNCVIRPAMYLTPTAQITGCV